MSIIQPRLAFLTQDNHRYADYARYLSECTYDDATHTSLIHTSRVHYRKASAIAEASLSPCHPLRLGVALNRAVLYVALGDRVRGVEITKAAFDAAFEAVLQKVESGVKRETLEDTVAGMDMLSDNYRLWTGEAIELQPCEWLSALDLRGTYGFFSKKSSPCRGTSISRRRPRQTTRLASVEDYDVPHSRQHCVSRYFIHSFLPHHLCYIHLSTR